MEDISQITSEDAVQRPPLVKPDLAKFQNDLNSANSGTVRENVIKEAVEGFTQIYHYTMPTLAWASRIQLSENQFEASVGKKGKNIFDASLETGVADFDAGFMAVEIFIKEFQLDVCRFLSALSIDDENLPLMELLRISSNGRSKNVSR